MKERVDAYEMVSLAALIFLVVFFTQIVSWVGKSVLQELVSYDSPPNLSSPLFQQLETDNQEKESNANIPIGLLSLLSSFPLLHSVETTFPPKPDSHR